MAAQSFDVWFVKADTVYRGVPPGVVTDWALQGRVAADDRVRPAGVESAWQRVGDHPLLSDFLFRKGETTAESADYAEQLQKVEMDVSPRKRAEDDDDDPDMIPLIDISLVLLVFFMMTTAVAALSPVEVPDMKHAAELTEDDDAFAVHIDKRAANDVFYALRVGKRPPAPEDNNLPTQEALLRRLDDRLTQAQRPPAVLIVCNREIERGWVRDLAQELDKRKTKRLISTYSAEVNEKTK